MSDHFHKEIAFLGIESSPAFFRAPEGNGCAERFIRTLKKNLLWVKTFETIEELRQALLAFRETYNTTWLIERHGLYHADSLPRQAASNQTQGGVGFNPVSQKKPRAVHVHVGGVWSTKGPPALIACRGKAALTAARSRKSPG